MAFYNDRFSLVIDSLDNINLFKMSDKKIIQYYFNNMTQLVTETTVAEDVYLEYDVSVDNQQCIYLLYQDMSFDLYLTLLKDNNIETIRLTGEPIPQVYYLNIILNGNEPHIFYFVLLSEAEKRYGIYHHYYNGEDWFTNIVDEVTIRELLNPMKIIKNDRELIIAYYDKDEDEEIYMKSFDLSREEWGEKIKLTTNGAHKLYLDIILKDEMLKLTYSQYEEGNLVVKYEQLNYKDGVVKKEIEEVLSNPENAQYPTLTFYDEKLWVVWVEYENIMSRYSTDRGNTWSPIYLWNESKGNDIVRYKYCMHRENEIILNHYFGTIGSDISFIGFGPTHNTTEIPLKKKIYMKFPKLFPQL